MSTVTGISNEHELTPQSRKANAEIKEILRPLIELGLPITLPSQLSSPSTRGDSITDKINTHIKYLYYQNRSELDGLVKKVATEWKFTDPQFDPVRELETRLKDLAHLTRNRPKPSPLTDKLRASKSKSEQKCVSDYFAKQKRRSPDVDDLKCPEAKQLRRGLSESTSCASRTTWGTGRSTTLSSVSSFHRTSTARTSSDVHDDAAFEEFGPNQNDALLGLDVDGTAEAIADSKGLHRMKSSDTIVYDHTASSCRLEETLEKKRTDKAMTERGGSPAVSVASSKDCKDRNFRLKNLANESILGHQHPEPIAQLPFRLQWLVYRAFHDLDADESDLLRRLRKFADPSSRQELVKTWLGGYMSLNEVDAAGRNAYRGSLQVDPGHAKRQSDDAGTSLFAFEARPASEDALCRLERRFGPDRFLTVTFCADSQSRFGSQPKDFEKDFRKFLAKPQIVFGRHFRCFWVFKERTEKRDVKEWQGKREGDSSITIYTIRYFATNGPDLRTIDAATFLDWFLNYTDPFNAKQPFSKLLARTELYLSKTSETCVFEPSQVQFMLYGTDRIADMSPEPTEFNDEAKKFPMPSCKSPPDMSDGCCLISPGAARIVCDKLNISYNRPVAFQARINGCKGMWYIAGPYDSSDQSIWIKINKSQRKIDPKKEDRLNFTAEPNRWAFDVVSVSYMPKASNLHVDFLPILQNRHVPDEVLIDIARQQIELDLERFREALDDSAELRRWLADMFAGKEIKNREQDFEFLVAFPGEDLEKVIYLIEAGFEAEKLVTLAEPLFKVWSQWLQDVLAKLKLRLNKSAMAYGIADNAGRLAPGEIMLAFSQNFIDPDTGETITELEGDVLVARHPAMRNSDIQRVRAVYKPELSHLRDVIVFPTRGCVPLASKLQGGDYDGDTFWVCWDRRIVQHFRNAPAPVGDLRPEDFGIKVRPETFKDVLHGKQARPNIERVLKEMLKVRLQESPLGKVTNAHKRLAYMKGNLEDAKVIRLANIHDVIIDAPKNGYIYTEDDYAKLMRERGMPKSLQDPAYERALKEGLTNPDAPQPKMPHSSSIVDKLVFQHILPKVIEFRAEIKQRLRVADRNHHPDSKVLLRPYLQLKELSLRNDVAKVNLKHLNSSVKKVADEWTQKFARTEEAKLGGSAYRDFADGLYADYRQILPVSAETTPFAIARSSASELERAVAPTKLENPVVDLDTPEDILIHCWTNHFSEHDHTQWDLMRASSLYAYLVEMRRKTKVAFVMAARELAFLKATSISKDWRAITPSIHSTYKPRKVRQRLKKGKLTSMCYGSDDEE